jgi:tetratricopeptide (TPR) repeat protein
LSKKKLYEQAENASTEADILAYGLEDRSIYEQVRQVHARVLTAWADELFAEGLGEQAKIKLLEAHRYDESYPDACRLLSRIYFDDGDYRQAVYYLQRAADLSPDDTALQTELAQVKKESELDNNLRARKRGGFKVEFSGSEEYDLSGEVFDILGSAKKDIGRLFDFYPHETLLVKIYSPEHSAKLSAGPHWAAGLYDGKIRVRVDDVRKGGTRLKDILYHEYAHAVLYYLTRRNLPTWLNEGLAQNVEPGNRITSSDKRRVRQWLQDSQYIPFEQMPRSFVSLPEEEAHRVYVESRLFVDYLLDKQGEIRMRDALGRLRQGRSVDEAFRSAFGQSLSELERAWIREEL